MNKDVFLNKSKNSVQIFGLNLIEAFNFKDENFWSFLNIVLSLCGSYVSLALSFIIIKELVKIKSYFLELIESILEAFLPIIGHLCFLPICVSALQAFRCDEEISDDLAKSFFFRDCTQYCYRGKHLGYAAASGFILSLYLAVSIYLRPYWEKCQKSLSIRSNVAHLSILSVFQITLALVKTNLEVYTEKASGFSFFIILGLQALITFLIEPFNYKRLKVLQILILSVSSWIYLISTVSLWYSNKLPLLIILYLGTGLICLIGFKYLFNYPNIFHSDNPKLIPVLFKFQFIENIERTVRFSKYFTGNSETIKHKHEDS